MKIGPALAKFLWPSTLCTPTPIPFPQRLPAHDWWQSESAQYWPSAGCQHSRQILGQHWALIVCRYWFDTGPMQVQALAQCWDGVYCRHLGWVCPLLAHCWWSTLCRHWTNTVPMSTPSHLPIQIRHWADTNTYIAPVRAIHVLVNHHQSILSYQQQIFTNQSILCHAKQSENMESKFKSSSMHKQNITNFRQNQIWIKHQSMLYR